VWYSLCKLGGKIPNLIGWENVKENAIALERAGKRQNKNRREKAETKIACYSTRKLGGKMTKLK